MRAKGSITFAANGRTYRPSFRELIAWFFTFGLVGLGMQITMASIRQAGGQPLVIGSVVGVLKAVGSFFVVLLLVSETI